MINLSNYPLLLNQKSKFCLDYLFRSETLLATEAELQPTTNTAFTPPPPSSSCLRHRRQQVRRTHRAGWVNSQPTCWSLAEPRLAAGQILPCAGCSPDSAGMPGQSHGCWKHHADHPTVTFHRLSCSWWRQHPMQPWSPLPPQRASKRSVRRRSPGGKQSLCFQDENNRQQVRLTFLLTAYLRASRHSWC